MFPKNNFRFLFVFFIIFSIGDFYFSNKNFVKNYCRNLSPKYFRGILINNNTNKKIKAEVKFASDYFSSHEISKGEKKLIERSIKVENGNWEKCDPIIELDIICNGQRKNVKLIM